MKVIAIMTGTTIPVSREFHDWLKSKGKKGESYEDIILKIMKHIENEKRHKIEAMVEGCKEMAEDSLRITKEWETTDSRLDWEW